MSTLKLNEIPTLRGRRLRWVEALESGQYSQCSEILKLTKYYCCLGVACQLSGLGKFHINGTFFVAKGSDSEESSSDDLIGLPSVRKLLEMSTEQQNLATALNDGEQDTEDYKYRGRTFERKSHSFKEIATIFRNIWRLGKAA